MGPRRSAKYSSMINLTTNFSYSRDIRSSRSSSGSPFTPPCQICLIQIRYHAHYWMMIKQPCLFFTIPFHINKQVYTCICVANVKNCALELIHLPGLWLLWTACMASDVAMRIWTNIHMPLPPMVPTPFLFSNSFILLITTYSVDQIIQVVVLVW